MYGAVRRAAGRESRTMLPVDMALAIKHREQISIGSMQRGPRETLREREVNKARDRTLKGKMLQDSSYFVASRQ